MKLLEIRRYPVKSMQGETIMHAQIEADGITGDRCWGVRDEATGKILTARREPRLLHAAATTVDGGQVVITLPDGDVIGPGGQSAAVLSDWLGKPVSLVKSVEVPPSQAEFFADATDDSSEALEWTMPAGRFVDAMPLLVLTTASLRTAAMHYPGGDWNPRRFRANLLLDVDSEGWPEDGWYGGPELRVGTARLLPQQGCIRCTMVTRAQPEVGEDRDIFRTLAGKHGGLFGAWTAVAVAGSVSVGDDVTVS